MSKYDISTLRHSSAHVMAQAILRLFPDEKVELGIGPVIEDGFYYDVDMDHRLTEEDLKNIEKVMKTIIKENLPIIRQVMTRTEALDFFSKAGQSLKVELIRELPENDEITCYTQGEFTDLCRGPHVQKTGELPTSFKLLHTAGAYWRGDSDNKMLQRVYATSFTSKDELKEHLNFLEEAKKRDHRKLGKELDLFIFDQSAPASPFFTPKGTFIYNKLIDFMRNIYRYYNYQEIITPQILDRDLWHTSGHYEHYKENMYFTSLDNRDYAIKPMNCPAHMLLFKHSKYSYRDLPLRFADFGRIHRYEKSGTLAGLTRVRTFCQDDGHIFLPIAGIQEEISLLIDMFLTIYDHFGFQNIRINLSTRPIKKAGNDSSWDQAEHALKEALGRSGLEYTIKEGEGAFYGPKIDMEVSDAIKRYHQLGTIQLDFQLPERFDLKFVNQQGNIERPVVIHRALLGSMERFFGLYLEHIAGAYPFWLAPEQAIIVPINSDNHLDYCKELEKEMIRSGLRVKVDDRNESMGFKTRQIQKAKIPFMLAIGDQEMKDNTISVRRYGERQSVTLAKNDLFVLFKKLDQENIPQKLRHYYGS